MPTLRTLKTTVTNPVMAKRVARYVKNDVNAILGRYHYPARTIFIAGMPKSGTTWLSSMLSDMPGYNLRPINDPQGVTIYHNITDSVFLSLPKYGYSILKLHTKYSPQNYEVITRYTDKFIVMYRDLRDMCVSRYFHVKAEPEHRHHQMYQEMSLEEGMAHSITMLGEHYVDWMRDWYQQIRKHPDVILPVSYEELNQHTVETLSKVTDFYGIALPDALLTEMATTKLKRQGDLEKNLKGNKSQLIRSTARKGSIGDWRNHFTEGHRKLFKDIAGDILTEVGYEESADWA